MHLIMNVEFLQCVITQISTNKGVIKIAVFSTMGLVVNLLTDAFSVDPSDGLMCK